MKSLGSFMTGLLAGAALGGIIALLYAPQSGKETRDKVRQKFADLEKELEDLKSKSGQKSAKVRSDIASRLSELREEIDKLSKEVS
ncbi:MAG: YtxH domain-containing protein [Bacteroidales bacterium]|jgi:gas vesicle protein|nr:YtxH domain-containing protein [Bacteroidales bacterium]